MKSIKGVVLGYYDAKTNQRWYAGVMPELMSDGDVFILASTLEDFNLMRSCLVPEDA